MGPSERHVKDNKPPARRKDYALFFFERQGNNSYLRFTRLGVTVILLLTVVPLILVLLLFLVNSQTSIEPNIKDYIPAQTSTPYSDNRPLIIQRPTSLPQPRIRQQPMSVPNPLRESPAVNSNERLMPKPSATPPSSNRSVNTG